MMYEKEDAQVMLSVKNLAFSYKTKDVLKDISFEVRQGQVMAVLGRNAAGKTTLINILTGLLEAKEGKIYICGEDSSQKLSRKARARTGVMRPINGVFEKMTCYEYLEFIAALYEVNREAISALAQKYEFTSELKRKIKECSAGTRKKIELSAAVIHSPALLFLDEPFESVDPVVVAEIKGYIQSFAESGGAVIITSHILDIIQNISTDCIIINKGFIEYSAKVNKDIKAGDEEGLERIFLKVISEDEYE